MTNKEAIDILEQRKTCMECVVNCTCEECDEAFDLAIKALEQQPKTGHWIDRFPAKECKCSVCDFLICISNGSYIDMVGQMKYCPNCGAKMIEPQERSDKE